MKHALAATLGGFQSLDSDDSCERPVDRLAAAGAIGRQVGRAQEAMRAATLCGLGVDLIAFKFGHRAASGPDAIDQLSAAMHWPQHKLSLKGVQWRRVAAWAVREWSVDICPTCKGAAVVPDHDQKDLEGAQPMKPCSECHATGKRRYRDSERAKALGGNFDEGLAVAHMLIGWAEGLAIAHAKKMLERS